MTRKNLLDNDAAQFDDVVGRLRRLEQSTPEPPRYVGDAGEPAFENSWVNFDAAAPPAGRAAFFYRYNGRVYLGGVIKTGASGAAAFTLPAGYLPLLQGTTSIAVVASGASAEVDITAAGAVTPTNLPGSAVATFCFLEGVNFRCA